MTDIIIRLRRLYDETGLSVLADAITEIAANRAAASMYEAILGLDRPKQESQPAERDGTTASSPLRSPISPERSAARSEHISPERRRGLEEAAKVVEDFRPPQPEASEFSKGAAFTARQIWAAIRALIPPSSEGGSPR
jgi:hypothetical protein